MDSLQNSCINYEDFPPKEAHIFSDETPALKCFQMLCGHKTTLTALSNRPIFNDRNVPHQHCPVWSPLTTCDFSVFEL